jgi:hypothetical protein
VKSSQVLRHGAARWREGLDKQSLEGEHKESTRLSNGLTDASRRQSIVVMLDDVGNNKEPHPSSKRLAAQSENNGSRQVLGARKIHVGAFRAPDIGNVYCVTRWEERLLSLMIQLRSGNDDVII